MQGRTGRTSTIRPLRGRQHFPFVRFPGFKNQPSNSGRLVFAYLLFLSGSRVLGDGGDKIEDVADHPLVAEVHVVIGLIPEDDLLGLAAVQAVGGHDGLLGKVFGKLGDGPAGFLIAVVE